MTYHCFFEQSGTFKNAFKKLGFNSFDYDLKNDFGETDFIINIFKEIDNYWNGDISIFDNFNSNDFVFAFFPCTRFSHQMQINFTGNEPHMKFYTKQELMLSDIKFHDELHFLYTMLCKLVYISLSKNFKLVIENPYNKQHYLVKYWSIPATIIDMDRSKDGDYFKKPTQYFFINCEPKHNFLFDPIPIIENRKTVLSESNKVKRSLISSCYANRFIRKYIID